jgi:hypothetical protein
VPLPAALYRRVGATEFPILPQHLSSTAFVDQAKDTMLALFSAAIKYELGWTVGATIAGSPWHTVRGDTPFATLDAVADTFGMPAYQQIIQERQQELPCLYLGRSGEPTFEEFLIDRYRLTQDWILSYVLGPLDVAKAKRLNALHTKIVPSLIALVCNEGCHPAYDDGLPQFGEGTGLLRDIVVTGWSTDPIPVGGGDNAPLWYGCTATLRTEEESDVLPGDSTEFDGASTWEIGVGNQSDGILPAIVNFRT